MTNTMTAKGLKKNQTVSRPTWEPIPPTSRILWIALLLLVLAVVNFVRETSPLSQYIVSDREKSNPKAVSSAATNSARCLDFDRGGDLDGLIDEAGVVYLLANAKAGGSSMKLFLKNCFGKKPEFMLDRLEMNKVQFIRIDPRQNDLNDTFKHSSKNSLFVMTYREETDRLGSAIKHVMGWICQMGRSNDRAEPVIETKGDRFSCVIDERQFVHEIIKKQNTEIGGSTLALLGCGFHQSLEENAPNLVMMSMNKLDDLLKLLSRKYSCPDETLKLSSNALQKNWDYYLRINNGTNVEIGEWLGHKLDHLQLELKLNKGVTCKGKTYGMAEQITTCPNEAILNFYNRPA